MNAPLQRLQKLVEILKRRLAAGAVPDEDVIKVKWFVTQASAYLNGEYETIDEALGLIEK